MAAPKDNQNAVRTEAGPSNTWLQVRVTSEEKARWVKSARNRKLSDWVREKLNQAST